MIDIIKMMCNSFVTPGPDIDILTDNYYSSIWCAAQYGNYQMVVSGTTLLYSDDQGVTYKNSIAFSDAQKIQSAYMFRNGNVAFFIGNKAYFSSNQLVSYAEVIPLKMNDDVYVYHTPVDEAYPGSYYTMLSMPRPAFINNKEVIVWGPYGNYIYGNNPTNFWKMDEDGDLRVIYEFGQNTSYTDNGNLLGDSGSTEIVRHIHSCQYNAYNGKWYACSGDSNTEIHWYEITLTAGVWSVSKIFDGASNNIYKSVGFVFIDDYVYWGTDLTGTPYKNGIYYCHINDIANKAAHQEFATMGNDSYYAMTDMVYDSITDNFLCVFFVPQNQLWVVNKTNTALQKFITGATAGTFFGQISQKNTNGYYRILTAYVRSAQTPSYFIRIGTDIYDA